MYISWWEKHFSLFSERKREQEREREREKERDMSLRGEKPSTHVGCTRGVGLCNILVERLGTWNLRPGWVSFLSGFQLKSPQEEDRGGPLSPDYSFENHRKRKPPPGGGASFDQYVYYNVMGVSYSSKAIRLSCSISNKRFSISDHVSYTKEPYFSRGLSVGLFYMRAQPWSFTGLGLFCERVLFFIGLFSRTLLQEFFWYDSCTRVLLHDSPGTLTIFFHIPGSLLKQIPLAKKPNLSPKEPYRPQQDSVTPICDFATQTDTRHDSFMYASRLARVWDVWRRHVS